MSWLLKDIESIKSLACSRCVVVHKGLWFRAMGPLTSNNEEEMNDILRKSLELQLCKFGYLNLVCNKGVDCGMLSSETWNVIAEA